MYKFYQTSTTENKKVDDSESVKKELDSYNAAKMLLPGFFDKEEKAVYESLQKNSKINKENDLSIDNKNEKVSFLNKVASTPNTNTNYSNENGKLFLHSERQSFPKKSSKELLDFGIDGLRAKKEKIKNGIEEYSGRLKQVGNRALNTIENMKNIYYDNTELRSALFALKSPRHAAAVLTTGPGIYNNHLNLASTAERIAKSGKVLDGVNNKDTREQGNEHGAVRHALWQAALSSWFFDDVAKDAGDAHETRPYADTNKRIFKNLDDADMVVDLLNNKIGRGIGNSNRFTGLKNLALNVLEEFKRNGLYVADDIDGVYVVSRRTLDQEKYEKLRALFESMDNWGFQPGDDRVRDNYAPIRFIWEKIKEKF